MLARWTLILALVTQSLIARPMACSSNGDSELRDLSAAADHSCCCGDGCSMLQATSDTDSESAICGCGDEFGPAKSVPAIPASDHDPSTLAAVLSASTSLLAHAPSEAASRPAMSATLPCGGRTRLAIHCIWML
jgi:hypothetical protein